jgi:hypothetical protein
VLIALCNVLDQGVQQVAYVTIYQELSNKKISLQLTALNIIQVYEIQCLVLLPKITTHMCARNLGRSRERESIGVGPRDARQLVHISDVAPETLLVAQGGRAHGTRGQSQVHAQVLGARLLRPKLFIAHFALIGPCEHTVHRF